MPQAALRPCPQPGCAALVVSGRCAAHAVVQEHQRPNYDLRKLYRRARWCHPVWGVRSQVLRDMPLCVECQAADQITVATDVHHKQKHYGDLSLFYDVHNLVALCASHHAAHTARGE